MNIKKFIVMMLTSFNCMMLFNGVYVSADENLNSYYDVIADICGGSVAIYKDKEVTVDEAVYYDDLLYSGEMINDYVAFDECNGVYQYKIVDMDNDGIEELIFNYASCVYSIPLRVTDAESTLYIYTMENGKPLKIFEGENISVSGYNTSYDLGISEVNGKKYLIVSEYGVEGASLTEYRIYYKEDNSIKMKKDLYSISYNTYGPVNDAEYKDLTNGEKLMIESQFEEEASKYMNYVGRGIDGNNYGTQLFFEPHEKINRITDISELDSAKKISSNYAIYVVLNGKALFFEEYPYIKNGTTMVPMRGIFEELGVSVEYDAVTKTITAYKGSTVIELVTGSSRARINGGEVYLSVPVENKNGTTMVPARFVSEALGAQVLWDSVNKVVTINSENIETENQEDIDELSTENPFIGCSIEILNIYDNRNNILDAIAWGYSNITYGIEHIFDFEEEPQDIEYGKLVIADILNKVPENNYKIEDIEDAKDVSDVINVADDGLSLINDYFGTASEESLLLGEAVDNIDSVVDWSLFTAEEIAYILNDYGSNIMYFKILKENSEDEYINELIDELMVDYTNKWYKTVIDVNEKIVDGTIEGGLDVGLGAYTAGLYPLAKYTSEVYSSISGLKEKTDNIANFYLVCRMIYPVDKAYENAVVRYNNGECDINEVKAMFELNKATKVYAYECIEGFAKGEDKDIAGERIAEINRINMKNGKIEISQGAGNGGMGGR